MSPLQQHFALKYFHIHTIVQGGVRSMRAFAVIRDCPVTASVAHNASIPFIPSTVVVTCASSCLHVIACPGAVHVSSMRACMYVSVASYADHARASRCSHDSFGIVYIVIIACASRNARVVTWFNPSLFLPHGVDDILCLGHTR